MAKTRQSFWPWMAGYEARGICRHIYARAGRGAVAVLDVESNDQLHKILNEWADIVPAHFDTCPLIDAQAAQRMLAAQTAAKK
jgi:muconolactone delta-isomerase